MSIVVLRSVHVSMLILILVWCAVGVIVDEGVAW